MDEAPDRVDSGGWLIRVVVSALGAGGVVFLALTLFERRSDPVYSIAPYQIALASVGGLAALCGLAGLLLIRRYDLAALAAVASGLLITGWAAVLTIGMLLILLAIIPTWMLANRISQASDWLAVLTGSGSGWDCCCSPGSPSSHHSWYAASQGRPSAFQANTATGPVRRPVTVTAKWGGQSSTAIPFRTSASALNSWRSSCQARLARAVPVSKAWAADCTYCVLRVGMDERVRLI
jgi:hypothetical protein